MSKPGQPEPGVSPITRRSLLNAMMQVSVLAAMPLGTVGLARAETAKAGGTFSLPLISNPALWPLIGGVQNVMVNRVLFNSLTTYDDPGQQVVGDLAESWEVAEDGLTWTFKLRPNAKWHDGTPFTAADVAFTINDVWRNSKIAFPQRSNFSSLTGAEAVDDQTVKLVTDIPTPALPVLLGYLAPMLPKHILGSWAPEDFANPGKFSASPVGTGPFKYAEFVPGSHVRLEPFEEFFGGKPALDAITFKVMPDVEQQFAQLQSGQLDWMLIEPYQIEAIQSNSKIKINEVLSNTYFCISLNNGEAPFNDKAVRQALSYATDRQSIIDSALMGKGAVAYSPITPVLAKFHNPDVQKYSYDPAKAVEVLEAAGWVKGAGGIRAKDGVPLKITLEVDAGNLTREQIALIVQENWKAIGADVTIQSGDFGALVKRLRAKPSQVHASVTWYITAPDPDITSYFGTDKTLNIFAYSNTEVDKLLEEGRQTIDLEKRAEIYRKAQELIAEDAATVFLYYAHDLECVSAGVEGWSPTLGYRYALAQVAGLTKA